jgi:hypothetical protein
MITRSMNGAERHILAENRNEPFDLAPLAKADGISEALIMIGARSRFQSRGFAERGNEHVGRIDATTIGYVE